MRLYEGLFVIQPDLNQDDNKKVVQQIETQITKAGGSIESSQEWGRRTLTYTIRRKREGLYYRMHFRVPPQAIDPLKRICGLNETILNTYITKLED